MFSNIALTPRALEKGSRLITASASCCDTRKSEAPKGVEDSSADPALVIRLPTRSTVGLPRRSPEASPVLLNEKIGS